MQTQQPIASTNAVKIESTFFIKQILTFVFLFMTIRLRNAYFILYIIYTLSRNFNSFVQICCFLPILIFNTGQSAESLSALITRANFKNYKLSFVLPLYLERCNMYNVINNFNIWCFAKFLRILNFFEPFCILRCLYY